MSKYKVISHGEEPIVTDGETRMYIDDLCEEANVLLSKNEKLKRLMLLTDPDMGGVVMNDLTKRQWLSFIKEFPDERDVL